LEQYVTADENVPDVLAEAMKYSLLAGGKRFRPVLTILTGEVFGVSRDYCMPTACAIEYIHTYSLIHDDLPSVDNDDLRRGRPTCHKMFGEDIAIMAGDALFAAAFSLVATLQEAPDTSNINRTVRELADAAGPSGMVGGQVVDMRSTGETAGLATVRFIHERKTGRLIAAAARCGAILAGADEAEIEAIGEYGKRLGLCFQIVDDILDETGTVEDMGKNPGHDSAQSKATYPAATGLDQAKTMAAAEAEAAMAALKAIDRDTETLRRLAVFVFTRKG
jgi:geranylgeranyl diphosphate synthase type II